VVGFNALCFLYCFDTVGWVTGSTSGLQNSEPLIPKWNNGGLTDCTYLRQKYTVYW